jgi:heme-degrading monooxygenase HmoA
VGLISQHGLRLPLTVYVIVWEFIIRAECVGEFEAIYGPQGEWARLFAKTEGYRETQLLRDTTNPSHYVTLDLWTSRETHERFRREHEREYMVLDKRCERLTVKEHKLGEFLSRQ